MSQSLRKSGRLVLDWLKLDINILNGRNPFVNQVGWFGAGQKGKGHCPGSQSLRKSGRLVPTHQPQDAISDIRLKSRNPFVNQVGWFIMRVMPMKITEMKSQSLRKSGRLVQ